MSKTRADTVKAWIYDTIREKVEVKKSEIVDKWGHLWFRDSGAIIITK